MKKILSIASAILFLSLSVKADMMAITFSGQIYSFTDYNTGITTSPLTNVNYTFYYDEGENGILTYNDGSTKIFTEKYLGYHDYKYFYCDFKRNYALPDGGASSYENNYIRVDNLLWYNEWSTTLVGGTENHTVSVSTNLRPSLASDYVYGINAYYGDEVSKYPGYNCEALSSLTVTSISRVPSVPPSVPEPSVFPMMLCGIILLGVFVSLRRRFN